MPLLVVDQLTKKYNGTIAVNEVSFELRAGKCVALIGPNGAGKTTTLRLLTQLIKPTSGKITFPMIGKTKDIRNFIGYLPQYPVFYDWMTGKEFLVFSGELAHLSKQDAEKKADELLEKVGISEAKSKRIRTYSGGMRQRLGIAQALIHQPKLLILDEPVSALDPLGRREVLTLIEELKQHVTILFSTHILSDADEVSDELLLLHKGELVEAGSMNELRRKYQTATITLGWDSFDPVYQEKLEQLPSVTRCTFNNDTLILSVTNIEKAREEILTTVYQKKWPVTHFMVYKASL